jgi:class 3 adenylate cyclase/CheY-like chemotaxis protein
MANKKVILCVDDEMIILESLKAELKTIFQKDYVIEIAENGHDALELVDELLESHYEICLVISDYLMPQMKGDEVLKNIHEKSPDTIKIMLTGQATIEGVANAVKYAKLYRYMPKPWQMEDFKLTVVEAVNRYLQEEQLRENHQLLKKLNHEQAELIERLHQNEKHLQKSLEAELKLTEVASRFVPNEFLALLGYTKLTDIALNDAVQKEMTILFSDIRGFTTLSEQMSATETFQFINAYLKHMEPIISKYKGFIDKYIGDAIMALFSGDADNAIQSAIAMISELEIYNLTRTQSFSEPIKIGIGINTGSLILGTVGGEKRMDGTVIGDAVNLSARMEVLTKNYDVSVLITQHTFSKLKKPLDYLIRKIDVVKVKGKTEEIIIYEVFDADFPEIKKAKQLTLGLFNQALSCYEQNKFQEALRLFRECLQKNPEDSVAKIYVERCQSPNMKG